MLKSRRARTLIIVSIAAIVATALPFLPELAGYSAGLAGLTGTLKLCYQIFPAPYVKDDAKRLIREKYGFDYQPGLSCTDGSWKNRYLGARNAVSGWWIRRRHHRTARALVEECIDEAYVSRYGLSSAAFWELPEDARKALRQRVGEVSP